MNKTDLTGKRFGSLTVIAEVPKPYISPSGTKARRWECICDCGKKLIVLHNALTAVRNGTRSCGCSRRKPRVRNVKTCVVCGKEFECPPSTNKITCSSECRSERKRRIMTGVKRPAEVGARISKSYKQLPMTDARIAAQTRATEAARLSPISGPFETNKEAKHWVLKSPENIIYEFDNLSLFIRQHPEWFPNPESARSALSAAASCMAEETTPLSRKGREFSQYKGWQVIRRTLKTGKE